MTRAPATRSPFRLRAAILSIPLRFKITIPYLIVAILLAGLATWLVTQSFTRGLQARFNDQLVDSFAVAADAVFRVEMDQLTAVRTVARTAGVSAALTAHDDAALDNIIRPIAANSHLTLVHVVDTSGQFVYGLRAAPGGYLLGEAASFASWEPVQRVLAGESDALGDKFAGVVEAPWGASLYTAGPVKDGDQLVGVVLVGMPVADLAVQMRRNSLANFTLFRPDGRVAATTFAGEAAEPDLTTEAVRGVNASGTLRLQNRLLRYEAADYNQALGPLTLRGQPSGWVIGSALPRSLLTQSAKFSLSQIGLGFAIGVLAIIGLGVVVAQIIAIPVFELVQAASRVAAGDLNVSVRAQSNDELGSLAQHFNQMVNELKQREYMRDLFGRVVSEEVREALLKGEVGLGGELKVVTVLFTDIRQFTSLSENQSPQKVVAVLNSYLQVVNGVIHEVGGFVNKFGGDSTLAVFGAPVAAPPEETARKALQAALTIRRRMAEFNARRVEAGQAAINIGIGINTGEVITGNVGSEERFEYTVIGDAVNVAARVQGLTSQYTDSNILITESTLAALGQRDSVWVVDHGEVALKGKARPVRVYGVIGTRPNRAVAVSRVGDMPRYTVLESIYLYCRGFDPKTIALAKKIHVGHVYRWLLSAAEHFEAASQDLCLEFGLTEAELERLRLFVDSDLWTPPTTKGDEAAAEPEMAAISVLDTPAAKGGGQGVGVLALRTPVEMEVR